MNKAIFSLDKLAEGNRLSSDQLSTIKGGRKSLASADKGATRGNNLDTEINLDGQANGNGLLVPPPPTK